MKAPYLKNYNRIYDYPNRTEQEKSQRTLDKMSFLLDYFNSYNEFLTKQVRNLMHYNSSLMMRSKEKLLAETGRGMSSHRLDSNTSQVSRNDISDRIEQRVNLNHRAESLSRLDARPNFYQGYSKRDPHHVKVVQESLRKVQRYFEPLKYKYSTSGYIHKNLKETPNTLPTQRYNYIPKTHEKVPYFGLSAEQETPAQSNAPQIEISKIISFDSQQESKEVKKSLSPYRKGIEVVSKEGSPLSRQSRIKKDLSKSKEKIIEVYQPYLPKEISIQVTPNLTKNTQKKDNRNLVTNNVNIMVEPNKQIVPSSLHNYPYVLNQPQRTSSTSKLVEKDTIVRHISNPEGNLYKKAEPQRTATEDSDAPRRPRILEQRDYKARGDSTRRRFLSLTSKGKPVNN